MQSPSAQKELSLLNLAGIFFARPCIVPEGEVYATSEPTLYTEVFNFYPYHHLIKGADQGSVFPQHTLYTVYTL